MKGGGGEKRNKWEEHMVGFTFLLVSEPLQPSTHAQCDKGRRSILDYFHLVNFFVSDKKENILKVLTDEGWKAYFKTSS